MGEASGVLVFRGWRSGPRETPACTARGSGRSLTVVFRLGFNLKASTPALNLILCELLIRCIFDFHERSIPLTAQRLIQIPFRNQLENPV